MLRRTETAEGQANLIADWQALGDWRLADDYLARALAVTADQLHDVARRYLDPAALTLLLYRPTAQPQYAKQPLIVHDRLFELPEAQRLARADERAKAPGPGDAAAAPVEAGN